MTKCLPRIKSGSLRFWGQWFGKPYDNWYQVTACDADGDLLRIHFPDKETLSVWRPRDAVVDEQTFRIGDADRVRWDWSYYGSEPGLPATGEFLEFTRTATGIIATASRQRMLRPD